MGTNIVLQMYAKLKHSKRRNGERSTNQWRDELKVLACWRWVATVEGRVVQWRRRWRTELFESRWTISPSEPLNKSIKIYSSTQFHWRRTLSRTQNKRSLSLWHLILILILLTTDWTSSKFRLRERWESTNDNEWFSVTVLQIRWDCCDERPHLLY